MTSSVRMLLYVLAGVLLLAGATSILNPLLPGPGETRPVILIHEIPMGGLSGGGAPSPGAFRTPPRVAIFRGPVATGKQPLEPLESAPCRCGSASWPSPPPCSFSSS